MLRKTSIPLLIVLLIPFFAFARTPNDEFYGDLWYLERIDAPDAWDVTIGSRDVIVAVLDAGVDLDHADLAENLWRNKGEILNGSDDDGNGFVDDLNGWDFVDDDNNPSPDTSAMASEDAIAHGSLISGLIGAVGNNGQGVVGVSWKVSIMPLRILNDIGAGSSTEAAAAIEYAVQNGADVINLSFSGEANDPQLQDAIENAYHAGVVIVAAMGNEGRNTDTNPSYPACYQSSEEDWVIGVASSDEFDRRSLFSNFGAICTDISAPGENIFGIDYHDPNEGFGEEYDGLWSGTSMASPLVAGTAALLLAEYPDLTPADIITILKLSVDPMNVVDPFKGKVGAGRLNIGRALEYGASFLSVPAEEPQEPVGGQTLFGPSPVTGELEEIIPVSIGHYITSPSFSTVYYVGGDDTRRPFMDTNTYFTYTDSFGTVVEVTDATLPTLSLKSLMLPKPGVVLIKIKSTPTVYVSEVNPSDAFSPILRAIETEEIAIDMYGDNWDDFVIDVSPTFFNYYSFGEPITEPESVDTSIMKTRQQLADLAF
ncbi:S8 family serine peptidase [Patescibacteria group bacterium]|nr:S8 family serine peptidase [Patescibacteria group bacterium]